MPEYAVGYVKACCPWAFKGTRHGNWYRVCAGLIMKHLFKLVVMLFPLAGFAQADIVKDPRIDLLVAKQHELNKKAYIENNRTASGFRILVVNTNDRNKAMDVKSTLMREFPDHKTYLIYQSPYFKIQIGNFRDRNDANSLLNLVKRIYSTGVFVVPSVIEVNLEEELMLDN